MTAATNTKIYDGTTTAAATPTITSGSLATGDTAAFTETYDTKNVGTGKTLTASGFGQRRQQRQQLQRTRSSTASTGVITAAPSRSRRSTNTKVYDGTTTCGGGADDHVGQPGRRGHGGASPRPTTPRTWARARR